MSLKANMGVRFETLGQPRVSIQYHFYIENRHLPNDNIVLQHSLPRSVH